MGILDICMAILIWYKLTEARLHMYAFMDWVHIGPGNVLSPVLRQAIGRLYVKA